MSHAATSSGVAGRPKSGPAWPMPLANNAAPAQLTARRSKVDIVDTPFAGHAPRLNRVAVIPVGRRVVSRPFFVRFLLVALVVGGTALQQRWAAVPLPRNAKPRQALPQHRLLQRRLYPTRARVGRYLDFGNPSCTRPRKTRDLVEPWALHAHPARGMRDHGLDPHGESELPCLTVGHQIRVVRGFVPGVGGAV